MAIGYQKREEYPKMSKQISGKAKDSDPGVVPRTEHGIMMKINLDVKEASMTDPWKTGPPRTQSNMKLMQKKQQQKDDGKEVLETNYES
jgi:hypothetical protein